MSQVLMNCIGALLFLSVSNRMDLEVGRLNVKIIELRLDLGDLKRQLNETKPTSVTLLSKANE